MRDREREQRKDNLRNNFSVSRSCGIRRGVRGSRANIKARIKVSPFPLLHVEAPLFSLPPRPRLCHSPFSNILPQEVEQLTRTTIPSSSHAPSFTPTLHPILTRCRCGDNLDLGYSGLAAPVSVGEDWASHLPSEGEDEKRRVILGQHVVGRSYSYRLDLLPRALANLPFFAVGCCFQARFHMPDIRHSAIATILLRATALLRKCDKPLCRLTCRTH